MKNKIISVKAKVKKCLEHYSQFRDSDNKLIAFIWAEECKLLQIPKKYFLSEFHKGKFSSPEAIRRARQKLQEENSSLRGKLYEERHREKEKVRQAIINNEI